MSDEAHDRQAAAFEALAQTVVTDDANLTDALRRVAGAGCGLLSTCVSASVTLIEGGRAVTVGPTSDVAQALDAAQYSAGDGPCLVAARHHVPVRIDNMAADARWPEFSQRALEHDVHSSLSMPLQIMGGDAEGGFNVYGRQIDGFSLEDEEICGAFAAHAAVVVSNARAYWAALTLSRNLGKAMDSRAVIEQAKGILMATDRVGAEDAFNLLRIRSQTENRKLRDVAGEIVDAIEDDDER